MIIPESIHQEFLLLKSAFENGSIKKMSDLEKEKPTRIAGLMGMNQGRYGSKLFKPEDFSPSEIIRLSLVINVDAGLIINVIKKELLDVEVKRILKNTEKLKVKKYKNE
jgi:hypothetical protein